MYLSDKIVSELKLIFQVISKPENRCGLPESDVRFIARDVSSAIEYLHSMKIIHRDLKPDNVVLQTSADVEGDCERVCITWSRCHT